MATFEEGSIPLKPKARARRPRTGEPRGDSSRSNGRAAPAAKDADTDDASTDSQEKKAPGPVEVPEYYEHPLIKAHISDDPDAEACFVCADSIQFRATYPCGHYTCSKCALRLRALMKDSTCKYCRLEGSTVIISQKPIKFMDFKPEDLKYKDDKYGLVFDDRTVKDLCLDLLKFNCPVKTCHATLGNWKELKKHVQAEHNKLLCDICTRHKKVFTVELEYYNRQTLSKHERDGDKRGSRGHPQCEFCRLRFYSSDELFVHCREKHEKCFICERQTEGTPQYYKDYERLENHFEEEHYMCNVQSCRDQKFVVFGTKYELQDHMVSLHSEIVGKSKAARRVDTDFSFSRPGSSSFGSQLSTIRPGQKATPSSTAPSAQAVRGQAALDPNAFPTLGEAAVPGPQSSAQPANVANYHASIPASKQSADTLRRRLEERGRMYLSNDADRFAHFQKVNSDFRDSRIDATKLINEYSRLFDAKVNEIELIITDMAAVIEKKATARNNLLAALSSWKQRQTNFPAIGASHSAPGSRTNLSSSWVSSHASGPGRPALSSAQDFPTLIGAPSRPAASFKPSASSIGASRVVASSTQSTPASPKLSAEKFPSLPTTKVKRPPPVRPVAAPGPSAWGGGLQSEASNSEDDFPAFGTLTLGTAASVATKKKGKQKQVIYRLGL